MLKPPATEESLWVYPKNLNPQIHGLRGLATLIVFVYHLYGVSALAGFWPARLDPLSWLFEAGQHGVEIFFVISGYLITASLLRHANAARFLLDRCIRIYPVFLTIHILVFAIGPLIGYKWMAGISFSQWAAAFLSNALFLPGLFKLPLAQLNAWSLSYEAAFYLACAGFYVAGRLAGRTAMIAGLAVVIAWLLQYHSITVFFMVGAAIFFLNAWWPRLVPRTVRDVSAIALIATLAILTAGAPSMRTYSLASLPAFLFFLSLVEGRCALSALLRRRPLQYLGTISYSFYLWAPMVTFALKLAVDKLLLGRAEPLIVWVIFAVLGLAGSLIASHLSYVFLEDRAGRYFKAWLEKRRAVPAVA